MDSLEKLLAIEEIKQCKARYWRGIDSKHFELLRTTFTEDVEFDTCDALYDPVMGQHPDVPRRTEPTCGVENIIKNAEVSMNPSVQSAHMGHLPEIEILTDTTAKAIFPFEDRILNPGVGAFDAYGYYEDTLVKIDGQWKIKTSKICRYRVIFEEL